MKLCLGPTTGLLTHDGGVSPTSEDGSVPPLPPPIDVPGDEISGREAEMSVAMTEYFQESRRVYEQVSY